MRAPFLPIAVMLLIGVCHGCEDAKPFGDGSGGGDGDSDGDSDGDTDGDADADADGDADGPAGSLHGTVLAPNATTPISGALVYLTMGDAPPIPSQIHCYDCDDMTGKNWTLSGPDGGFLLENVPAGDWNLVTRKGMFQRQRPITASGTVQELPVSLTTLPGANTADGLDRIPNIAVLLATPDESYKLLGKFGLGQMSGSNLVWGTETFFPYRDRLNQSGYPSSTELFANDQTLHGYHMIFLPCNASNVGVSFANNRQQMLRDYVSGGGKIYNSCTVSLWTESPFPEYIEFYGNEATTKWDIGRYFSSAHHTQGSVIDQGMRDWLSVVSPASDIDSFPFMYGYTLIDGVDSVHGHGVEEDGYWVHPYVWVRGSASGVYQNTPLMVTYNYDCGKVFYSVYETSQNTAELTPQEYVLLYIILEIGVCEGDYVDPE